MKISKRTRDQAIMLCAIAACEPQGRSSISEVGHELGYHHKAFMLAYHARCFAQNFLELSIETGGLYELACAEAPPELD